MNYCFSIFVIAGMCVSGCMQEHATRAELTRKEIKSLKSYCTGTAQNAEAALRECERYCGCCQRDGVSGIRFDEVFARTYGRLYIVEKHLGKNAAAEEYFQKAAALYHKSLAANGRSVVRPHEMQLLLEKELDRGLKVAWKTD